MVISTICRPARPVIRFLIGLLLFPGFLLAQNGVQIDTNEVSALLKRSEDFRFTAPDSALVLAQQAIALASQKGYLAGEAEGYKLVGLVQSDRNSFTEALEQFTRSLQVYQQARDTNGISSIQNNIGSVYQTTGNDPKALEYFFESLKNAEIVKDAKRIGTAYVNIGTVYSNDALTYEQAIENYRKSIPYFESVDYALGLAVANVNIGELYLKENRPEPSLPFLNDALEGFREIGIDPATPLNMLGEAYLKLADYPRAEAYYQQALASSKEKGTKSEEAKAYLGMGRASLEHQSPTAAIRHFNAALELAGEANLLRETNDAYKGLAEAYALQRDYRKAFEAQRNLAAVSDTLRTKDYATQMSKLRTVYDLERKEQEIELLNAENSLNTLQIEKDARDKQTLYIILFLLLAIFAGFVFQFFYMRRANRRLDYERNRSEQILLNILPKETADELKEKGHIQAKAIEQITVLFTDFKAFSVIAERISAEMLVKSVDYFFKNFDEIIERHNLEKIKTIGDAYMCAGGLPTVNQTNAKDAIGAAVEMLRFVLETERNPPKGIYPFKVRIGLNSGPVVAGVVGIKKFAYDIWGNTVNIAARMESGSDTGRINVSENTYQLLKDSCRFSYRGELEVKNGMMLKMYFLELPEGA